MMVTQVVWVLVVCALGSLAVSPRHQAASSAPLSFTVQTRRTATGQWQAEVDVVHGDGLYALTVEHRTETSGGDEPTVHSKTTITAGNISLDVATCAPLASPTVLFTCGAPEDSGPCGGQRIPATTRVIMACKEGHMQRGAGVKEITCLKTGAWSGPELKCHGVPTGYEFFSGLGWYQLYVVGNTFQQARRVCEYDGGRLGVVDSPGELDALMTLINRSRPAINVEHEDIYMGVSKQGGQEYVSFSGRPMTASYHFKWCPGRPPASPYGDCTIFTKHSRCHWDSACGRKLAFLCEIPLDEAQQ